MAGRVVGRVLASVLLVALAVEPLGAQGGSPVALRADIGSTDAATVGLEVGPGITLAPPTAANVTSAPPLKAAANASANAPWWAPVLSMVLPGAGQLALGQQRSVAYVVAEGYLLLQHLRARRDADRDRDAYRTLASDVARKPFGGDRPRGGWDYYESMERFLESGAFDRIAGGAVDPESDETTYNGARWLLARETFWQNPNVPPPAGSPEYVRALAFYEARAVRDPYRWSWRDARLEQDVYAQTIASANRSVQRAVNYVGLVGANHLVSVIDAYVSVRIRRYGGAGLGGLSVEGIHTAIEPVGDPREHKRQLRAAVRLVPAMR